MKKTLNDLVNIYLQYTMSYLEWLSTQLILNNTMYSKEEIDAVNLAISIKKGNKIYE